MTAASIASASSRRRVRAPARRRSGCPWPGAIATKISGCGSGMRPACPLGRAFKDEAVSSHRASTSRPPPANSADADFRALQVLHDADRPADLALERTDRRVHLRMVLLRAVAEIEPESVHSRQEQGTEHLRATSSPGRWWRRSWHDGHGALMCSAGDGRLCMNECSLSRQRLTLLFPDAWNEAAAE